MQKSVIILLSILCLTACDLKTITDAVGGAGLTEGEVGNGLKEALTKGISKGAAQLSSNNGYFNSPYKILLPEEVQEVTSKLQAIPGFRNFETEMVKRINNAAADAAKKAKPIFVDAIRSMTIADAWNILRGSNNAATNYLKDKTYQNLYRTFQPEILESLNKFKAVDYWENAITKYNSLPLVKDINPRLDDYVTNEALKGLFGKVAEEEKNIRENSLARTSDLLKRVFAEQD